jgi:hypothetical protein
MGCETLPSMKGRGFSTGDVLQIFTHSILVSFVRAESLERCENKGSLVVLAHCVILWEEDATWRRELVSNRPAGLIKTVFTRI